MYTQYMFWKSCSWLDNESGTILREVIILTKEWVRNRIILLEILFLTHSLLVTSYWNRKIETEPKSNKSNWAKTKPNQMKTKFFTTCLKSLTPSVMHTVCMMEASKRIFFACKLTKPESKFVTKFILQWWSHTLIWVPNFLIRKVNVTKLLWLYSLENYSNRHI